MRVSGRRRFLQYAAASAVGVTATGLANGPLSWLTPIVRGAQPEGVFEQNGGQDSSLPDLGFHPGGPRNAEPEPQKLMESWMTPVSRFFIRSHGANPVIDPAAYRLIIEGLVDRPLTLTLAELAQFAPAECTCTLTCAGNRRSEFSRIKPVGGVQWRQAAIGNAAWSGIRLAELLKFAGVKESAKHVWFDGLDEVKDGEKSFPFGGSVPLSKVFEDSPHSPGALLATHMNGAPLTADHGMPLRAVVPGYIGARSVKWLGRITVSNRPSPNHYVEDVYKILESDTLIRRDEAAPIYRFPVNSAICSSPVAGFDQSRIQLAGYALPFGDPGTTITAVEISSDGGRNWIATKLSDDSREFCWRLWSGEVPIHRRTSSVVVRATDSAGHQQPETIAWNPKGYLYNAWHNVPLIRN